MSIIWILAAVAVAGYLIWLYHDNDDIDMDDGDAPSLIVEEPQPMGFHTMKANLA